MGCHSCRKGRAIKTSECNQPVKIISEIHDGVIQSPILLFLNLRHILKKKTSNVAQKETNIHGSLNRIQRLKIQSKTRSKHSAMTNLIV